MPVETSFRRYWPVYSQERHYGDCIFPSCHTFPSLPLLFPLYCPAYTTSHLALDNICLDMLDEGQQSWRHTTVPAAAYRLFSVCQCGVELVQRKQRSGDDLAPNRIATSQEAAGTHAGHSVIGLGFRFILTQLWSPRRHRPSPRRLS